MDIYRPLGERKIEIRVLIVEAGHPRDAVRCHFQVVSLAEGWGSHYETVSYCWGDASVRSTVVINDARIEVPASSEAAIRAVRSVDHTKTIWIDALCINQTDLTEKASQIAHMERFYERGDCNNIYLGDDADSVAKGHFEAIGTLASRIRQDAPTSSDYEREEWTRRGYLPRAWVLNNLMSREDKNCMECLLHLAWFNRLWTMQDFALSTKNICIWGSARIDLDDIAVAAQFYVEALRSSPADFDMEAGRRAAAVHSFLRLAQDACQTIGPYDFNMRSRYETITSRTASNPRDYVFGFVGLLKAWKKWDVLPDLLQPDYHKSAEEVFRDATRAVLEMNGDGIFEYVHFEKESDLVNALLPTWAVRWDTQPTKSISLPPESNAGNGLDERNVLKVNRNVANAGVLEVQGIAPL